MGNVAGGFNPCTICSSNPKYFERNDKIALSTWSVVCGLIYAYMGYFLHKQCPAEPDLPFWAFCGGIGVCIANPMFFFMWSRDLLNLAGGDRREKIVKVAKLVLLGGAVVLAAIWWIIGCVAHYQVRNRVIYEYHPKENYCDPVLYIITLETVAVIAVCLLGGLVWLVGRYVYEPTYRSQVKSKILNLC